MFLRVRNCVRMISGIKMSVICDKSRSTKRKKKMSEEFQSKFVLPKKLPPYLPEYIGYMEIRKAIDCNMSQQFIGALTATWPDYSSTTRVRKQREKNDAEFKAAVNEEVKKMRTQNEEEVCTEQGCFKRLKNHIGKITASVGKATGMYGGRKTRRKTRRSGRKTRHSRR